jgi:cell division protein FtsQ
MWDKPQALRQLANTLFGFSLLMLLFGAVHYAVHLPMFSLESVQLTVAPQRVDEEQIREIVRTRLQGNFFTVDLENTRKTFETLPWVRKVTVRRHFPWRLEVNLEEHEALARWNDASLVNTHGEVFSAEGEGIAQDDSGLQAFNREHAKGMPKFYGQADSAGEITKMYQEFGKLLVPLKHNVVQISLSPRRAWQLRLDNGMILELGREKMQERLARFVSVYPYSLASLSRPVNYVDLRYNNGFAAYLPGGSGVVKGAS